MTETTPSFDTLLQQLETATHFQEQSPTGAALASAVVASVQAHAQIRIAMALEQIADEFKRATLADIEDAIAQGDYK